MRLNTQSCNYDFLWIDTDEWLWGWTDKKLTLFSICSHSHAKNSSWVYIQAPSAVRTGRRWFCLSRWTSVKGSVQCLQCCPPEPAHHFIKRKYSQTTTYKHCFSESDSASLCFSHLLVSLRPWVTSDLWPLTHSTFLYINTTNHCDLLRWCIYI